MKRKLITSSLLLSLFLTSCGQEPSRPIDYKSDFWICDSVNINLLNSDNIYQKDNQKIAYLDSKYTLKHSDDDSISLPEKRVSYIIKCINNEWLVDSVFITDPTIKIYGLSMNSSQLSIETTFKAKGYEYLEYSGLPNAYSKNHIEFRICQQYISIWAYLSEKAA